MKRKLLLALAGGCLAAGLGLSPAYALGPAPVSGLTADGTAAQVHFKHRSCELGPYGWHRHRGWAGYRVPCYPRAWNPHRCWVNRWGVRHCWW